MIFINAYAKINLLLDVLYKRPDGYHELEGIMQSVSLCDRVFIRPSEDIEIVSDAPLPYSNTCRRAAEAFLAGSGLGARITVEKRIPSEAGLGGASADAAAVLGGLNELFRGSGLEKSPSELMALGLSVGADVPFCLTGGCAIARGVGEKLTPVRGAELPLLIVRGPRGVSTGRLFSSLGVGSEMRSRLAPGSLESAFAALDAGSVPGLCAALGNALQPAAEELAPEIGEYVRRMREAGALSACMTGSGAAVFGIFAGEAEARRAKERFADCDFAQVCRTLCGPGEPLVRFRKGSAADAALTAKLKLAAWETTYRGIYPDELIDGWDMEERTRREAEKFASPGMEGFIIESGAAPNGTPCGFLFIRDDGELYIPALYLLREYRGRGIGGAAFRLIRDICRERGHKSFTCHCNAHNLPALAFYARMGGTELSRSVGHENKRDDQISLKFGL